MEANGNRLKTKIHKPGISRNCTAHVSYSQESGRRTFSFTSRDSSPELGLNSLSGLLSRRQQRTTVEPGLTEIFSSNNLFSEVPSYNLWRSRVDRDRRRSLPNCFTSPQRKTSTSSGVFVPSVITRESKGLRKYSTSLRDTSVEYQDKTMTHTKAVNNDRRAGSAYNFVPAGKICKQTNNREHPGVCNSPSLQFDSVSTMRCSSTDTSLPRYDETRSYYGKNDRIRRWLSEVE